ncbi:MAG: amidohydrolase family protein [Thermoleophilia bacterium]|nr:amidohydrolase family protein [Thermoleophilia bacterium]
MDDPLERARRLIASYDEELVRDLPADSEVVDVHTHLGNDIDGMSATYEELMGILDRYGISRACVFCLDEPDREPGFRAPNDRTLAHAGRSGGRLVPFVRLDLTHDPVGEAVRCLDRGARGIKLHPRAQRFALHDERLAPIFELAADRRVPILIHGGRGLPPIAEHLAALVERYPGAQLIVAHAGIADMAGLAGLLGGKAGVFFDTSVWSPIDLLDLYRLVAPEQVLFASDYPYGQQPASLLIALRTARAAGFDDDRLRDMLASSANRILDGEPPAQPTAPVGDETFVQPLTYARIHQYLSMATPLLWTRQADTIGVLGLALNACYERNGRRAETDDIKELLSCARELWRTLPEYEEERERMLMTRTTFRLIHIADILAVTTRA